MVEIQQLLEQASALHDHLCPRQVLGIRIGLYAAELLNLSLPQTDKRLYTLVETDGCFADGVSVAAGCWMGHRTMRLMDYGKVAATFFDTQTERAFRIWPHPKARQTAVCLAPSTRGHWQSQLEAYQIMSNNELLCASAVQLNLSMKALISRPGVRAICSVCGEEILNEREVVVDGQILCQSCADGSYYQLPEPILTDHHE